ncbi:MAG TPA: SDR family oxidoreductase [Burkholderiales bacterium]|nr:SDR family oxidoreductase [Burkholderiales bacterium]
MAGDNVVLITGADGFVGRMLCEALAAAGRRVKRALRAVQPGLPDAVAVGDIGGETDWRAALEAASAVVHLAARTHVLRETAADPLAEYRRVNVDGTRRLAQQAVRCGVRRLVFVSSIKVNGEATGRPFTENDAPRPGDAYGISKWEAEQALARVAAETGLEVVVLRPSLVYGPGVKGNFLRLMNLVARRVPLPLASIANRRSLVYAGNLVDAVLKAIDAPGAAGRTYLISDGEDVSTPDLVRALAQALGVAPRLLPCPPAALMIGATLAGRRAELARLAGSLQVDAAAARRDLGWRPRFTLSQGLAETARWYYSQSSA